MPDSTLDGATTNPPTYATAANAGEFAARWNAHTEAEREEHLQAVREAVRRGSDCYVRNHASRLQHAETALYRADIVERLSELEERFEAYDAPLTLAIRDKYECLYLVGCNENGDLFYQGIPTGESAEDSEANNGFITDDPVPGSPGPRFPVTIVGAGGNI